MGSDQLDHPPKPKLACLAVLAACAGAGGQINPLRVTLPRAANCAAEYTNRVVIELRAEQHSPKEPSRVLEIAT